MKRAFRIGIVVLLPLITLSLGWGLGMRYAQQQVADTMSQLEFLYQGKTASGTLVHDPEKEVNLALLWGVWRLLQQHYIAPEKLETTTMLFGATSGYTLCEESKTSCRFGFSLSSAKSCSTLCGSHACLAMEDNEAGTTCQQETNMSCGGSPCTCASTLSDGICTCGK